MDRVGLVGTWMGWVGKFGNLVGGCILSSSQSLSSQSIKSNGVKLIQVKSSVSVYSFLSSSW